MELKPRLVNFLLEFQSFNQRQKDKYEMPKMRCEIRYRLVRKGSMRVRREDSDKEDEVAVIQRQCCGTVMSGVCIFIQSM